MSLVLSGSNGITFPDGTGPLDGDAVENDRATSGELTVAAGATIVTWAHGLGARPKFVSLHLICKSADGNYSVDDVIALAETGSGYGGWEVDATNVTYRTNAGSGSSVGRTVNHNSAYAAFTPDASKWKMIIEVAA